MCSLQNIYKEKLHIHQKCFYKQFEIFHQQMHTSLKKKNLNRKVLKIQRYSSVTLHVSPKNPISAENLKITFATIQILPRNFFPEWFGQKQIEAIRF